MANKKEQIIKKLSPYFPEWTKDFQDFLIWQNYGILEPVTPDYGLWDAMEYTYATLLPVEIYDQNKWNQGPLGGS